ncbi:MAG: shikimate dehydrogenase [Candidatus Bathyarchaeia archaeon]
MRRVSSETKLCGVIGDPIEHSLSPVMHNAAFEALNLDYVYLAFRVKKEDLRKSIDGIRGMNFVGVNVTIPHKVNVLPLLDWLDPVAEAIGAVNTIHNQDGELLGYNTDGVGALKALKGRAALRRKRIVILGAGGAARALAFYLAKECDEITILNRTGDRAASLAKDLTNRKLGAVVLGLPLNQENLRQSLATADILINATSVGMFPRINDTLVPSQFLSPSLVTFDIVYNPPKTKLLSDAEAKGATAISGVEMFVNQGALSFEIWTGKEAPTEIMRKVVITELRKLLK